MKTHHLLPVKILAILFIPFLLIQCTGETATNNTEEATTEDPIALAASWADTAQMKQYVLWDWKGAESAFQKALELDAKLGRAHAHYGWLHQLRGNDTQALQEMELAIQAEPQNPLWHAWKGWMLLWADDGSEAMEAAQGGLAVDSSFSVSHYIIGTVYKERGEAEKAIEHMEIAAQDPMFVFGLGVAHAHTGNIEKALEIAQQLADTGETWNLWGIAEIYTTLGDKEKAMEWVQKAFDQKHPYIPWLEKNIILATLSEDPRYQEIVEAMKLPSI